MANCYPRFGEDYCLHVERNRRKSAWKNWLPFTGEREGVPCFCVSWFDLNVAPVNFFETSTTIYQLTRSHIVEDYDIYYLIICHESMTVNLTAIVRSGFTANGIFGGRSESGGWLFKYLRVPLSVSFR